MRSIHKYCAPTVELRFAQLGLSGSAGGLTGLGPTWQKPHDMPTRYGLTSSCFRSMTDRCNSVAESHAFAARSSKSGFGKSRSRRLRSRSRSTSRPEPSLPRAPISTPGYFCFVLERIGRTVADRSRTSSQRPNRSRIRGRRLREARLVHQSRDDPSDCRAFVCSVGIRRDRLEQVEVAEADELSRSHRRSLPPVHTSHVSRPLISSGVNAMPPSMSWK